MLEKSIKWMFAVFFILQVIFYSRLFAQQNFNVQKMDSLVQTLDVNHKLMMSVAICKNNEVVYARASGYSWFDESLQLRANTDTRYRIGSITKTFTSVIVHQLIHEGKLTLTTPLSKFFPKVPNAKKITIDHLLTHRSGIHNFTDDENYTTYNTQLHKQADMLKIISSSKPDFEPGTEASYSNSNYVLLGYIIEKITRSTYADNLQKRIVQPLNLSRTSVGGPAVATQNEAKSFTYINKTWKTETETDMSVPGGAGAIVSTPSDLTHYAYALFTGKLVDADGLQHMMTIKDNYGAGLFEIPFYERTGYGHTGGIDEFASILVYFPDDSVSVVVSSNGHPYSLNEFVLGLLEIYYGMPYTMPVFSTYEVKEETLADYVGEYHNKLMQLNMAVTREGTTLMAQPDGQANIIFEAVDEFTFRHEGADVTLVFKRGEDGQVHEFTLKQGVMEFNFIRLK